MHGATIIGLICSEHSSMHGTTIIGHIYSEHQIMHGATIIGRICSEHSKMHEAIIIGRLCSEHQNMHGTTIGRIQSVHLEHQCMHVTDIIWYLCCEHRSMYGACSELKLCTEQKFWAHMLGASKYMYGATIIGHMHCSEYQTLHGAAIIEYICSEYWPLNPASKSGLWNMLGALKCVRSSHYCMLFALNCLGIWRLIIRTERQLQVMDVLCYIYEGCPSKSALSL